MKRIVSVALILILLCACAFAEVGSFVDAPKGNTYLRSSASLKGKAISVLHTGEYAEYLDEKAKDERGVTWYKVSFKGRNGWVSEKYTLLHADGKTVKATGGDTNVRTEPELSASSLGTLKKGQSATYMGETKKDSRGVKWFSISFKGRIGWVSEKYATLSGTPAPEPTKSGTVTVTGDSVYVRSSASLSGKNLGTVQKNAKLDYLGETEKDDRGVAWYKVSFKGKTGWISSKYSKLNGSPETDKTVKAVGGDTNVRTEPKLSAKSLGTLHKGESAKYLGETRKDERGVKWYKISFKSKTGWVSEKYTKLQ